MSQSPGTSAKERLVDEDDIFQPPNQTLYPRYTGIPTFMRVPYVETRPDWISPWWVSSIVPSPIVGARHGPRAAGSIELDPPRPPRHARQPFELCKIADVGDTPVNPVNVAKCLELIPNSIGQSQRPVSHCLAVT